jgi:putative transposase
MPTVRDEIRNWQNRPLDPVYPVVVFDLLRVKIRDKGTVKNKTIYFVGPASVRRE